MWDGIFQFRLRKLSEEWWLNAGSHWECDLIPQNDGIQKEGSCHHPFLYFPPFIPSYFFLFLISISGNGNSVLKLFSLSPSFSLVATPFHFLHFFLSSLLFFPFDPPHVVSCAIFAVCDTALGIQGSVSVTRN